LGFLVVKPSVKARMSAALAVVHCTASTEFPSLSAASTCSGVIALYKFYARF
jgi:hypothetical protein